MQGGVRYGELTFDPSFLFARHGADEELKFTRSERALLLAFTRHPRVVLTRNQLLDAIAGTGSDTTDRSVDFLINRLRAKLRDPARAPALIATQYGEGYVWIADPVRSDVLIDAFLIIGPVSGLDRLESKTMARRFLSSLQEDLDRRTGVGRTIALVESWRPGAGIGTGAPAAGVQFSLDVSFYGAGERLHVAAVLRDGSSRQILATYRLSLDTPDAVRVESDLLAGRLQAAIWHQLTLGSLSQAAPTDRPLELRMHDAARMLARSDDSWIAMGEQLAEARANQPDDPATSLMWGLYLHSRLLLGAASAHLTPEARTGLENEIETIVFQVLPDIAENPILMLAAAKLLLFTGRGHEGLAEQLAEQAFAASTAFAAAFAILGQIRLAAGAAEQAVDLYDHGLELAEPGSQFEVYLLVLRSAAQLAGGDREGMEATCERLYRIQPGARLQMALVTARPDTTLPAEALLIHTPFDFARAQSLVMYFYYVFARLYRRQEHRENLLRGVIAHMVRRFGPTVVEEEIWRAVPGLVPPEAGWPA